MFFSMRLSTGLMVCGLTLACAVSASHPVWADTAASADQAPSVQVYGNQVIPDSPDSEGVLPQGMKWNRPLKAGDLALDKEVTDAVKKKTAEKFKSPNSPVGELKPPVITGQNNKPTTPPQITGDKNSTSSMMLLQGMKNALQQSGQNPDIPKSDINARTEITATATGSVKTELQAPVLQKTSGALSSPTLVAPQIDQSGVAYEPGQGPKALATAHGVSQDAPTSATVEPKATDMADAPPSLSAVVDGDVPAPSATEATATSALTDGEVSAPETTQTKKSSGLSAFISSIFGESVEDKAAKTSSEADTDSASEDVIDSETGKTIAKVEDVNVDCMPTVVKWTRNCQEAGYPSYFGGEIVGETRTICPAGTAREVWISNTCSASFVKDAAPATAQESAAPASEIVAPAEMVASEAATRDEPTDASCGSLNGLAAAQAPVGDLCQHGTVIAVQGDGPWRWSCRGLHGGMTVSCAAPVAQAASGAAVATAQSGAVAHSSSVEDGQCGAAASQGGNESAPTGDLCLKGAPSRVSGSGPWTWACSGSNGGQAAACSAQKKADGVCGTASRDGVDGMPARDLCAAGYASAVTGNGPWNWTCSGLYGGGAVTCAAQPRVDAVCGAASAVGHRDTPTDNLCFVGTASRLEGQGPWSWTCDGQHGGAMVACRAPVLTDASCGPANGSQYVQTPSKGLCTSGRSSLVTGNGPWNWTCMGTDGGNTVGCAASVGTAESLKDTVACGEATETLALSKPTGNLCATGMASDLSGSGPWTWSCADDAGHTASCTTLTASDGTCGAAANISSSSAPRSGLCESGMPSEVEADRSHEKWAWKCEGSMGGSSTSCQAPLVAQTAGAMALAKASDMSAALPSELPDVTAACGQAAGRSSLGKPDDSLCAAGSASKVRGEGPWSWTCQASGKKGASVSCESSKIVDAACGTANGSMQKAAPMAGLCAAGAATDVHGAGPWMWSCIGAGGGNSVSCSALSQLQTRVEGTCGATANISVLSQPTADLCDSGTPSTVYGDGPWTWTCSGLNGGIASTCRANKLLPKAPPPPGPYVNGLCGSANGVPHNEAPHEGLCSTGTVTALAGEGPWTWNCLGHNGGMTVSCVAPLTPPDPIIGACGAASGVPTLTTPKGALCSAGITSAVSGNGPWTWSCSGTNGGGAVSCVAPVAGKGSAGAVPSLSTPSLKGEAPSPSASPVGLVTPTLPSGQMAPLKSDTLSNRKSSKPVASKKKTKASEETAVASSAGTLQAPDEAPLLPDGMQALNPPPIRDRLQPTSGLKPPVIDNEGKPIPGARLALEPEISTIGFSSGSDQLDKDSVAVLEKLAVIMRSHSDSRITLVAYASTSIDRAPREARRLSLNRALAIRDFLVAKGIPSGRVDVRPMGANVPSGDMDRVDIRVN